LTSKQGKPKQRQSSPGLSTQRSSLMSRQSNLSLVPKSHRTSKEELDFVVFKKVLGGIRIKQNFQNFLVERFKEKHQ